MTIQFDNSSNIQPLPPEREYHAHDDSGEHEPYLDFSNTQARLMAIRSSRIADAIRAGKTYHPDWAQVKGALFGSYNGKTVTRSEYKVEPDRVGAACALGFALAGGLICDADKIENELEWIVDDNNELAAVTVPELNDDFGWSLDKIAERLAAGAQRANDMFNINITPELVRDTNITGNDENDYY